MREKLTKKWIDKQNQPPGTRLVVWDTTVVGLGLVITATRKTFVIQYGPAHRRRRHTFGVYGELTLDEAQEKARKMLAAARDGDDPAEAAAKRRAMPDWKEWVTEYMAIVRQRKKRPDADQYALVGHYGFKRAGAPDRKLIPSPVARRWNRRRLDTITSEDVAAQLHRTATDRGRIAANREFASIRACFAEAVRRGIIPSNPAALVKKLPENEPRRRVLTDEELSRVLGEVMKLPPVPKVALLTLVFLGLRVSELRRARWEDVDLDSALWVIPSPKAGRPQAVPIPTELVKHLRALPRSSCWVFPSPRNSDRPWSEIRSVWKKVCAEAQVAGAWLHDVRRTFGKRIWKSAGVLAASKLLRHGDTRITSRVYLPLEAEELRETVEKAAVLPFPKAVGQSITGEVENGGEE